MALINTIFAVIDPTIQNQRALNRAVFGAKTTGARIHVYACIHSAMAADDEEELSKVETSRYRAWIDEIVKPIKAQGIDVEVEIEWSNDWRAALGNAATRAGSDLIIKHSHRRKMSKRMLLSSSDWMLFRNANCPVILAKSERSSGSGKILLALDLLHSEDRIIDAMLDFARAAEESYENGELHVVSAAERSSDYVHVTDLTKRTAVPTSRVHVIGERPERAIAQCAEDLDVELVVIGAAKTSRLTTFGSSTEWLLNHMDRDIEVVIPKLANDEFAAQEA